MLVEASDIAVPAVNYRAVDFVVGRGGKQRLDLFLLGKYSCGVADLQLTVLGLCLSPSEGCEILTWCCFPFAASQISLYYPSYFVFCGSPCLGANGMIIICDWGRGLGCDLWPMVVPCTLMTLSKLRVDFIIKICLVVLQKHFPTFPRDFFFFFCSRKGEVASKAVCVWDEAVCPWVCLQW